MFWTSAFAGVTLREKFYEIGNIPSLHYFVGFGDALNIYTFVGR
jgi:hypothetical protein